ncbi:hypothetical protein BDR04DRAFT_1121838 [Suillus decipiens]|nr:hypothetical protein BDR04DRAFT_1121838 [Suillus decipiens]
MSVMCKTSSNHELPIATSWSSELKMKWDLKVTDLFMARKEFLWVQWYELIDQVSTWDTSTMDLLQPMSLGGVILFPLSLVKGDSLMDWVFQHVQEIKMIALEWGILICTTAPYKLDHKINTLNVLSKMSEMMRTSKALMKIRMILIIALASKTGISDTTNKVVLYHPNGTHNKGCNFSMALLRPVLTSLVLGIPVTTVQLAGYLALGHQPIVSALYCLPVGLDTLQGPQVSVLFLNLPWLKGKMGNDEMLHGIYNYFPLGYQHAKELMDESELILQTTWVKLSAMTSTPGVRQQIHPKKASPWIMQFLYNTHWVISYSMNDACIFGLGNFFGLTLTHSIGTLLQMFYAFLTHQAAKEVIFHIVFRTTTTNYMRLTIADLEPAIFQHATHPPVDLLALVGSCCYQSLLTKLVSIWGTTDVMPQYPPQDQDPDIGTLRSQMRVLYTVINRGMTLFQIPSLSQLLCCLDGSTHMILLLFLITAIANLCEELEHRSSLNCPKKLAAVGDIMVQQSVSLLASDVENMGQ